jgi:outer membrane protein assembly factor BamB
MISQFQDDTIGNLLHVYASQVISGEHVFTLGHGGRLTANHITSGDRAWSVTFSGLHTPAIIGEYLYVTDDNACLYCINKETGKVRWSTSLPENEDQRKPVNWTNPIIADRAVLLVTEHGHIVFFDAGSGKIIRKIESLVKNPTSAVVVNKVLYVLSNQGYLYAFG